ncbi:hypothetical protein NA57DRAFT_15224, partial [Rhizodiscina lignyota]
MPPLPRKIANRVPNGPQRYRPGKPLAPEVESSDEEDEDEEENEAPSPPAAANPPPPRPAATSFPRARLNKPVEQPNEDDFETEESEDDEDRSGDESETSEEEGSSEEEESSSEDEAAKQRKLIRPVFIKKSERSFANGSANGGSKSEEQIAAEEEAKRKQRTDEMMQEQLEKQAAAVAAGKKFWDDEDIEEMEKIDDRDDLDLEAEEAAWKLRELKRVKRDRDAIIAAEMEREEVERRRNLDSEEREAEDREFLAKQKGEKDGRGQMAFLQKYHHKGAFFQDEMREKGLDKRDIMGAKFADDVDRSVLPQFMQVRDMTKLGRKGRTKYRDLKSEDTGRWGEFDERNRRRKDGDLYDGRDERFMPDRGYDRERDRGAERTGANASALGERKR